LTRNLLPGNFVIQKNSMNISINVQTQLIAGCLAGNPGAQQAVFKAYSKKMLVLTSKYARDTMEAEDMLMLGFKKVFDRISSYNATGSFEGWIRRIMINCALNVYQQNQRLICTSPMEEAVDAPVQDASNHTDIEYLLNALQSLPTYLRISFNLFAIEGFSHKEIAENLGISEVLSKVRVNRARKALREALTSDVQKNAYTVKVA
jgi:RNA polymerase sigma factor (sigma-70 family)